jgi:small-conductance mechanosensitive channel
VARKLFYALAHPPHLQHYAMEVEKKHLDIHSFTPYFVSRDEAEEAFSIFDKDGNRNLTRREFRDTIIQIYRDRKSLAQSMRDTSQALGKIDNTLLIIQLLATTFISLAIFQVDFWAALVPFGTLLAACTFVFDSSARQLCQGILFQFVTHPYDAGDMVMIDGSYLTVENIGLLGTVFEAAEGDKVYAPTDVLITKLIHNVRRSGNMGEVITLNIDFRTDNSHIMTLKERMSEWVSEQTRDFAEGFDLRVTDIIDMNQVILTMWLPHKGNWVELGKRFQRKTRFMLAMKSILTDLDIRYELPAQKFTSDNGKRNPFENL